MSVVMLLKCLCISSGGHQIHFFLQTPTSAFFFHFSVNVLLPLCSSIEDASLPGERMCLYNNLYSICHTKAFLLCTCACLCVRASCAVFNNQVSSLVMDCQLIGYFPALYLFGFVFYHNCFSPHSATVCSEDVPHTHYSQPEHIQLDM